MRVTVGTVFVRLIPLAAATLLSAGCGGSSASAPPDAKGLPGYDQYSSKELGLSFAKPAAWKVFAWNGVVFIKETAESATGVFFVPVHRALPGMQAVSFMRFVADQSLKEHPDLQIEERRANAANTLAEVTASYSRQPGGQVIRGFYLVSLDGGRGLFCGYEAPPDTFDRTHAVLRNILKGLRISPATFDGAMRTGKVFGDSSASARREMTPTIDVSGLAVTRSADGSMYMAVPPGWTVGGGSISLIAAPPDSKMGVMATNDGQPATRDPYTYLTKALMPFYKATGTIVHKREPSDAIMQFSRSQGYVSKAENFTGETTTADGKRVYFWIMVNCATLPFGGGFVSTIGFYAVPELFERNVRVLYAMTASMGPDQQVIMGRFNEHLRGLDAASKTISATGDLVIQTLRSSSAAGDRIIDKYNYYLSGEEARYSPLENRIYVVDSNLDNYAGNPRFPHEMLTAVPDVLWNQLPHQRRFE